MAAHPKSSNGTVTADQRALEFLICADLNLKGAMAALQPTRKSLAIATILKAVVAVESARTALAETNR